MKVLKIIPGVLLSVVVALVAYTIEYMLPIHIIGSAVIAMFIGMLINHFVKDTKILESGLKFTSKKILKFAIILLGLSLNISTILNVGKMSLTVMIFTLATCFGGGYFIGKALGLNWKLSNLISAGTGICDDEIIAKAVGKVFDLRPLAIIRDLDLRRPIYRQTAAYGHVGRTDLDLPWEKLDKVEVLEKYL